MNKQIFPIARQKPQKKSPIYWMGNKGGQLVDMHRALPSEFDQLSEAFTGSASLSFSLLSEGRLLGKDIHLNDLNEPLMNFWQVLRDNPDALVNALLDLHEEHWGGNKALYNQACIDKCDMTLQPLNRAIAFYTHNVLTAGTVMLRDSNFCHPLNSGKGLHEEWILELIRFSKLLQDVNFLTGDFRKLKKKWLKKVGNKIFLFFFDPPYLIGKKKEKRYYAVDFNHKAFAKHCHAQREQGHVLITYDLNPVHIKRFRTWNIYSHWVYYRSGGYWDRELIITSYKIPFAKLWAEEDGWEIIKEDGVFYPRGRKPHGVERKVETKPLAANDNPAPLQRKAKKKPKKTVKRVKKYGEVFTPPELIKDMLDKIPNLDGHILEPACGNGNFVVEIIKRKIAAGISPMTTLKSIFAVDILPDNVLATRYRALEAAGLLNDGMAIFVVSRNIRKGNTLKMQFSMKKMSIPQWLLPQKTIADHNKDYVAKMMALYAETVIFDVKYFKVYHGDNPDMAKTLRQAMNPHEVKKQYQIMAKLDWIESEKGASAGSCYRNSEYVSDLVEQAFRTPLTN